MILKGTKAYKCADPNLKCWPPSILWLLSCPQSLYFLSTSYILFSFVLILTSTKLHYIYNAKGNIPTDPNNVALHKYISRTLVCTKNNNLASEASKRKPMKLEWHHSPSSLCTKFDGPQKSRSCTFLFFYLCMCSGFGPAIIIFYLTILYSVY